MAKRAREGGRDGAGVELARVELARVELARATPAEGDAGGAPAARTEEPIVAALPAEAPASVPSAPPDGDLHHRLQEKDQELARLREQLAGVLKVAEEQLGAAAKKYEEAEELRRRSLPPSPTELNEARIRAARLSAELTELRADRDEQRRAAEGARAELESAQGRLTALEAAQAAREERAALAEQAAHAAQELAAGALAQAGERAQSLEAGATAARLEAQEADARAQGLAARLQATEDEAQRLLQEGAARAKELGEVKAALDLARREVEGVRAEHARAAEQAVAEAHALRERVAVLELEAQAAHQQADTARAQGQTRVDQIVHEVREREARMVAEVQAREAQLIAAAQARETQLIADAKAVVVAAAQAQVDQADQIGRLQVAIDAGREREAALDAELRLLRGRALEGEEQAAGALEAARREARTARLELDELQERVGRSEARAAELQSVVDSLGRERAALRAEAGAMRARVETLQGAEQRLAAVQAELDELRGEYDFLNQEVARYASAARPSMPPPLPGKG